MSEWDEPINNAVLDKLEKCETGFTRVLIKRIRKAEKQLAQGKVIPQKEVFKCIKKKLNKRVKQFNKKKRS